MPVTFFPFRYYASLPKSTLTTKIRAETWNLDRLFPVFRNTRSEFRRRAKRIQSNISELPKLQHSISMLATEVRTGIKDLKRINFCDSAILYLYYSLLLHVYRLCRKEERKLEEEEENKSKKSRLKSQSFEDVKKAKKEIERKIKACASTIKGLQFGEKQLISASKLLLNWLSKLRWKAEKQAQREFSFSKFTFRSMENINRKIKVEAIKAKKLIPKETFLMNRISQGRIIGEDVVQLAKLVIEAIDRISKDAVYSSKLISKFESEFKKLKSAVEKLKKTIDNNKKITEEDKMKAIEPWDKVVRYVEEEVHKDLMEMFRNIFVEYKYIGTRPIGRAA